MKTKIYTIVNAITLRLKFLVIAILLGNAFFVSGQVQEAFVQRTSSYTPTQVIYNIQGDFTMIGNTNLTLQTYSPTTTNNGAWMVYVNTDNDPNTLNSSSADLTFSTENGAVPSCSNVIWAGLYWTGRPNTSTTDLAKRSIKFKGPGMSSYQSYIANASDIFYPGLSNGNYIYAAYTEVTDLVRTCGLGTYWAADMAVTVNQQGDNSGWCGGWGMIVVYENSLMKWRDVTIFDGYAFMQNTGGSYELPVSGFHTAQSGDINMKLGVMAGEGDVTTTGDYFKIRNWQDNAWIALSHGGNSTNNFFNSSIWTGGNTRNPNLVNNTGVDVSMFSIPNTGNAVITNNQTSTKFQYGTSSDGYSVFALAMAVDAYVITIEGINTLQSINGVPYISGDPLVVAPNDEIEFKLDVRNLGTEAINNAQIVIPIPYGASYVSCSNNIYYSPLPSPNNLYFDAGLGANGSIVWDIGSLPLPVDPSTLLADLTFTLRVTDDCSILMNPNCPLEIIVDGTISGTGAVSNVTASNISFIQGYQSQGSCQGIAITDPITLSVDATSYIAQNCQGESNINEYVYCNVGSNIPITDVSGHFPPGSHFYNQYPVIQTTTEYTINNPFPATSGTVTYYAIPPGTTDCYFEFTITVTNITSTPTVSSPVSYCLGETPQPLTATASDPSFTLFYYQTQNSPPQLSITPTISIPGTTTYYVAEGVSQSCISPNMVPITVIVTALPSASASSNSPVCSNGTLNLASNGGGNGGSYLWSGPNGFASTDQNPSINYVTAAIAGTYIVTVTNSSGCEATRSLYVGEPIVITANATSEAILCNGLTTMVTVTGDGGIPPYTGTGSFAVGAGTHDFLVIDAIGCEDLTTITILEPDTLLAFSTAGTILCNGGTTTVTVTASGGTEPYTGTGDFIVSAGTYSFTVTDANGCTATTSGTVSEPTLLEANSTAGTIACFGGTTTVDVSASGGTAPYTGIGTYTVSVGGYSYTVTDANGCTATTTGTVSEPTLLEASSIAGTIACFGGTTTVDVSASGGTAPYTGTGTYTVSVGGYSYTVTDANGCTATTSGTVAEPTLLEASSIAGTIACFGGTTTVEVSADGGTAPYTGTGIFTVSVGGYSYTVTDANGCTATTTGTVSEPTLLTASSVAGSIACFGGTTTVEVSADGGTAPYTGTGIFTVSVGGYSYTVTDANGCTTTTTGTVSEPTLLTASSVAGSIACFGGTTTVEVSADGGTAPYTGTGTYAVSVGGYSYTVTDANGCTVTTAGTVSEPTLLEASSVAGSIACFDGTTTVDVSASGGTAPYIGTGTYAVSVGGYSYTVTDANGCASTTAGTVSEPTLLEASSTAGTIACFGGTTTVDISASGGTAPYTGTGTYTVSVGGYSYTVTDANGCTSTTTGTVTEPTLLEASSTTGTIACFGGTTIVDVSASGGTAPYTGPGTYTVSIGEYSYLVTDANGCTSATAGTVSEPTLLEASSTAGTIACFGGTTIVDVSASGGTAPYTGTGTYTVSVGGYSYTVTDANGCTSTTTGTVSEPASLEAISTAGTIACFGGTTIVDVSASGGTAPYTGTGTFTVSIGGYSYTVTDANGCTSTTTGTVTEPTLLETSSTAGTIACFGGTTTVEVSADGGTAPYTGTGIFTVSVGGYSYTVIDANGCTATTAGTISEPTLLTASSVAGLIACFGGTTTVEVSADGGTAPYTGTGIFTVSAGGYSYTVTDANGCTATITGTVLEPTLLTASSVAGSIACFGGTTTVEVSADGGTAPYTGTGTFTVSVGGYSYTVTDANGCTATTTGTVSEPTLLEAVSSFGSIACFGGTTEVDVAASGGTAPYTGTGAFTVSAGAYSYTVTDANGCTSETSGTITEPTLLEVSSTAGLIACFEGTTEVEVIANGGTAPYIGTGLYIVSAGAYSYTVTDANGCTATTSGTVSEPTLFVASSTTGSIACFGGTTTVDVSASGGTSPYNGTGTYTVSAGGYSYTVTDANGCTSTTSGTVSEPTLLTASSVASAIACFGGTTTVDVSADGGIAPYTGTGTFTVSVGAYNYTVTDANGCTATTSGTVSEPTLLTASSVTGAIACFGGTTIVDVSANGGTTPYAGTGTFTVSAGAYSYTVTDANGCAATTTGIITEPTLLTANSVAGSIACFGGTTSVDVSADGGTAPYTGTGTFTVSVGAYSFTVIDANGCTATTSGTISEPTLLTASSVTGSIACFGGTTTVDVSADGGTAPYSGTGTYTVNAGGYSYTVTDANGCTATTSGTVSEPTLLTASSTSGSIACFGETTTVVVSADGGTAPYSGTGSFTVNGGTYNYTVTDANGCSAVTTITVSEPTLLTASSSALNLLCNGGTTIVTVTANGGTAPYTGTGDFTVSAGTYNYTVSDANGCVAYTSITIIQGPPLNISIASPPALNIRTCAFGWTANIILGYPGAAQTLTLSSTVTGGTPGFTYLWSGNGSQYLNSTTIANPIFNPLPQTAECWTYNLTLTVTDILGCHGTANVQIKVVRATGSANANCGPLGQKVMICHVPPGNHQNPQSICVSINALTAHTFGPSLGPDTLDLAHKYDCIGSCTPVCGTSSKDVNNESSENYIDDHSVVIAPNPFQTKTKIEFTITWSDKVTVGIYDINGQLIGTIFNNYVDSDTQQQAEFESGDLASGIYFYRIITSRGVYIGKLMLVKE